MTYINNKAGKTFNNNNILRHFGLYDYATYKILFIGLFSKIRPLQFLGVQAGHGFILVVTLY